MHLPAYKDASIVNLLSSVRLALGAQSPLYAPLPQLAACDLAGARNIVLIVIDGLGYEYLMQQRAGTLRDHVVARITSVFPPTTASAITTFFTGLAPQQHALTGWFTYFKELGAVAAPLPFKPRFGGTSLQESGVDASRLFHQPSMFADIDAHPYIVLPRHIVDSDYTRAHGGNAQRRAYTSLTHCFECIEEILRESDKQKYIYAYSPDLDTLAHAHGMASQQVAAHFLQLDAAVSRFLSSIRGSETVVIVTADHGIIDSPAENLIRLEDHPKLAKALTLPLCGEPRVAFCYVHPDKQQDFETYVRTTLADCATLMVSSELVDRGFFGLGEPSQHLLDRIGHYTLIMKDRYVIKDWVLGEHRYVHVGVHGGVSKQEVYVPLIVFAP